MKVSAGKSYPLGAHWDGNGTNFAIFSGHAERVELCLFESSALRAESLRVALPMRTDGVWHGYLPGIGPGQLYGYRVNGPYEPHHGHRFNPRKLLFDPYAKAVGRDLRWHGSLFGYRFDDPQADLSLDHRDDAAYASLGAVIDPRFDWNGDQPPRIPLRDTVIYETHVKGFTKRHPDVPEEIRGTYLGLCSDAAIDYFQKLGITAVELLPVHYHANEHHLHQLGLDNYWGYNTLGFFAPEICYAFNPEPNETVREFKTMVRRLHAAGLEVLLDVVYNHTAEGSQLGPTLSLRGIDNLIHYRLTGHDRRFCMDYTGTGNTLNTRDPRVLQLVMDSLRYWVQEMHVDGFRFDLAATLGREDHRFDVRSAFFAVLRQDPVLSRVKLIAEPWDIGEGGYQLGSFPPGWSSWNGRYRDDGRRVWNGNGSMSTLATRLSGSSDFFAHSGQRPQASINFITAHDGFTLHDLVSYQHKHNQANGENNRDGESHNNSNNYGVEGPTSDPKIRSLREQQKRNLLATLLLSQGVPMILGGDEIGRTQQGNNNAYCHDSELTWLDWDLSTEKKELLEFTRCLIRLRRQQPALRRSTFFDGSEIPGLGIKDVTWYNLKGQEMSSSDWHNQELRCLGCRIAGLLPMEVDDEGRPVRGDTLLLLFNKGKQNVVFPMPGHARPEKWVRLLDTADPGWARRYVSYARGYRLKGHSVAVFRLHTVTGRGR